MEVDSGSSRLIKNSAKPETATAIKTENIFPCTVCPETCDTIHKFKKHIRIHSGEKMHDCALCDATFSRNDHLKKHVLVHTGERNYACEICGTKFKTKAHLTGHMRTHTGAHFSCSECKKLFTRRIIARQHLKNHHKTDDFTRILTHPDGFKTTFPPKKNTPTPRCCVCPTMSNHDFKLHIDVQKDSGKILYKCLLCNESVATKSTLKKHMFFHSGERKHSCEICNSKFKTSSHLKAHVLIHSSVKPFCCFICKKSFTDKSSVGKHLRQIHKTESKNVPCTPDLIKNTTILPNL